MFRVALSSLLARKGRLFTTGIAIVLGVAFMAGTLVLSDTLTRAVNGLIGDAYQGVDAVVRSQVTQESDFGQPQRSPLPDTETATIAAVDGVRAVAGVVQGFPVLFGKDGKPLASGGFGPPTIAFNWIDDPALSTGSLNEGRAPAGPDEVAMDFKTARDNGFRLGDTVTVQLRELSRFTLVGIGGLGSQGNQSGGAKVLLFETTTAQRLLGKPGQFDLIQVAARDGVSQSELVSRLERAVPERNEVITGKAFVAEQQAEVEKILGFFTTAILAFGIIAVFVGTFIIYNTFSILITQRTRELALLRAVGASRRQLLTSVLVEAMAVGLGAGVLGLGLGYLLAAGLKGLLGNLITLPSQAPRLTLPTIAVSLLVGLGVTVLSAIIPAYRATRIPPVAAMSDVSLDRSGISLSRRIFGTLFLATGVALVALVLTRTADLGFVWLGIGSALIFVSVIVIGPVIASPVTHAIGRVVASGRGLTGRLAVENASRNPKRTTATAAALTVGVALVTVIAVMVTSIRDSISTTATNSFSRADLVVAGTSPFPPVITYAAGEAIAAAPGVGLSSPQRFGQVNVLNSRSARERQAAARAAGTAGADDPATQPAESAVFFGVNPAAYLQIADIGEIAPRVSDLADGEVMVLARAATENGWKVGDTIEVRSAVQESPFQQLRIAATFANSTGPALFYANLATFDRLATAELRADSAIFISVAPGASVSDVRRSVEQIVAREAPAAKVTDVAGLVKDRTAVFNPLIFMIYVLLALSILIALFGIRNTVSLSIIERTRELGLLRAVGMDAAQVRSAVRRESAIIAVFGTLLGIVIGTALAVAFVIAFDEPSIRPVIPWATLVVITLVGLLAGVLAARKPAKRAARLDILDAIAVT